MNDVLYMDKGRVTIPKDYRTRAGLEDGDTILFLESKSGGAILRPVNARPKMSLVEHLRQFRGLEIPEMRFHNQPRP